MSLVLAGAGALLVVALVVFLYGGQSAAPVDTEVSGSPESAGLEAAASIETPAETIPETNLFETKTNPYEGYENPFE